MKSFLSTALVLVLCSCAGSDGKKKQKSLDEVTLGQRLNKPDTSRRSRFEKYMSNAADARGTAGTQFQKQAFRSSNVAGLRQAGGMSDQFKTRQSMWGRMKFWGKDSAFSEASKASKMASKGFDAGTFKTEGAREGSKAFSGAGDVFETGPALSRADRIGRAPKIIENIDANSVKQGGYTEAEVKSILGRN